MQIELQNLQRDVGITFILVTHDQEEALSMSDSIAIMREGRIVQSGTPQELYDAPTSRYVADFVGESNFFPGRVTKVTGGGAEIEIGGGQHLDAPVNPSAPILAIGAAGVIVVRPEVVGMWRTGNAPKDLSVCRKAIVRNRIYLGDHSEFSVSAEGLGDVLARIPKALPLATELIPGDAVEIGWRSEQALALCEA